MLPSVLRRSIGRGAPRTENVGRAGKKTGGEEEWKIAFCQSQMQPCVAS